MIPENERIEFEDRTYVNPEVSLQEQTAFIDNLRNVQNQNNAEIATDTYNLGTAIPSNLGGLGGGESYFTSRYQVPQGVALANNLRATAQAQALNEILQNEQAMMKQRYNRAYSDYKRRNRNNNGGGGGGDNPTQDPVTGGVDEKPYKTNAKVTGGTLKGVPGKYNVVDPGAGNMHLVDMATGEYEMIHPPGKAAAIMYDIYQKYKAKPSSGR